jgi:hypothetical protein
MTREQRQIAKQKELIELFIHVKNDKWEFENINKLRKLQSELAALESESEPKEVKSAEHICKVCGITYNEPDDLFSHYDEVHNKSNE